MPDRSEREIWIEFKQGSDSALSYIYNKYIDVLFNYGCQINNSEQLVQDCIQDLFMDLIRSRERLADVNSIKYYLFTSLRWRVLKSLKKERKFLSNEFDGTTEKGFDIISSPEDRMINEQLSKEKRRIITLACQKLTKKQRECILLYFYEGFTYKQVAEIMGMGKVRSARVMVYRALDSLQAYLKHAKDQLTILTSLLISTFL
ncbi:MAG: DNA-directed RNA polymerase sigma-70 factor [Cyclobacteriaceae bacterium]|nr:MAG: DNA-directed RNA polymerase sigma-70 factor [Cyclobacteriaceae bacterium]